MKIARIEVRGPRTEWVLEGVETDPLDFSNLMGLIKAVTKGMELLKGTRPAPGKRKR